MSLAAVACRALSFRYDTAIEPVFEALTVHFPEGFTGIVGANGAGKSTLLQVISGFLAPTAGTIQGISRAVYCEQRTDAPPSTFTAFLDDWSTTAFELRARLEIAPDFLLRWHSLSHGERKRAQIGHALWQEPTLLAIDEPTNHIDAAARRLLINALKRFRGVALIVSHDRELLDDLCVQCVWMEPPSAILYAGNYTQARAQREQDQETALRSREKLQRENQRLQQEVSQRREQAAGEHQTRSKRGLSRHDHDAKEKIDRARLTDGNAGSGLRQLDGRLTRVREQLKNASVRKEYAGRIWLPGSVSPRNRVLALEPGAIELGPEKSLAVPELSMAPTDRVAISGPNGAGKSTLLRHIVESLNLPTDKLIYMPQEITEAESSTLLQAARALRNESLGHVMNVVSRLGSRPQRLLESRRPSPGETRKLLLALGMARAPHLIIMDEPTNHLDLPSIEALEEALADCPCALLLVSHDERFLQRLTTIGWRIDRNEEGDSIVNLD